MLCQYHPVTWSSGGSTTREVMISSSTAMLRIEDVPSKAQYVYIFAIAGD